MSGVWVASARVVGVAAWVLALPALWGGPAPHGGAPRAEGARRGAGDSAIGGGPGIEQGGAPMNRAWGVPYAIGDGGPWRDGGRGVAGTEHPVPGAPPPPPSTSSSATSRRTRRTGVCHSVEPSRAEREKETSDERVESSRVDVAIRADPRGNLKLDFFNFGSAGLCPVAFSPPGPEMYRDVPELGRARSIAPRCGIVAPELGPGSRAR